MKKYILFAVTIIFIVSCKPTKESRLKEIHNYEKQIMVESKEISKEKADSLLLMYDNFINDFPKDTNSTLFLYKAADISINIKECNKAINYLERIVLDFPSSTLVELAKFKIGVSYEQACSNKEKAKEAYTYFIEEYPNSPLVNDAAILLQMLDMPDEMEIIRMFEERNVETPTSSQTK